MYTTILELETSKKNSPRTNQGFLEEDLKCEPRLSNTASPTDGNQRLLGGGRWSTLRIGRLISLNLRL